MKTLKVALKFLIICLLILVLNQCRKDHSMVLNKKETLVLFDNTSGIGFTYRTYIFSSNQTNFSSSDYNNIDSISFVLSDVNMYEPSGKIITNDTLRVVLMDLSNNNLIADSKIITSGIDNTKYVASKNLYKYFSVSNPINIGVQVTFEGTGFWVLKHADLVLVRK